MAAAVVVVTIGRNVGQAAMPLEQWGRFKQDIAKAMLVLGAELWQRPSLTQGGGDQVGVWDGVLEDAAAFVASLPARRLRELRARLASIGANYGQRCIGLIVDKYAGKGLVWT